MRSRSVSWIQRAASLLLGCWLAVFTADPAAIHACPVHDVGRTSSHASHHPQHQHTPQSHHNCTCPGACCPGARAQLATTPTIAPTRIVSFVEPDVTVPRLVRSADVQITLPPALGPPAIAG
ncbi:MAG TPA: hypothetical protein VGH98_06940 [Gemmatimonadaceae bacterium]